jgi:hypothetical protein
VGVRQINLNASTVTLSNTTRAVGFIVDPNLTFNAGTSTVSCSSSGSSLNGGEKVFYNISFPSTFASPVRLVEVNSCNNLTIAGRSATGIKQVFITDNFTVSGTLTFSNTTAIKRLFVCSSNTGSDHAIGKTVTLTVNAVAGTADIDFRDIAGLGTSAPWTGTRLGDCGGNSGITFTAAATKYWNLAAGGSWSSTGWALSSGGSVSVNNFPLAQDAIVIENTGLNTSATVTINAAWNIASINTSTRTNAMTLASGTTTPFLFGDVTLSSAVTLTGTGLFTFAKQGATQTITSAGRTFTQPITVDMPGTFKCADAFTQDASQAFTIAAGTVEFAASATSTVGAFATSGTNQKFLQSTTAGTQATLSQASGTVDVSYLTIKDINATGGAVWNAYVNQENVDAGNNDGWDFGLSPVVGAYEYTYALRSFTQPKRF